VFRVLAFCLLCVLCSSCGPGSDAGPSTDAWSASPSQVAFQLDERDLFPEGMAYDPVTERFFMGSLRKSKIISISMDGVVDTLASAGELGQGGILGMKVDPERRILWANFHQAAEQLGADPSEPYRTGIHKIDLDSGSLIKSYSIEKADENFLLNDIALAQDGSVFMTSYSGGTLYRILAETDELEAWLPMPVDVFTNGIDMGPDGKFLFVVGDADIYRVEIETREMVRLEVPEGEFVGYGDGMYFHDGGLVVIASHREGEVLHYRVMRLRLSDELTSVTEIQLLDQDHPLFAYPTTGALVDGWFYYIATAQFDKIGQDGNVAPWDELSDIYVLRVEVGE
jgi:sugar lactone lactonase YvrE